MIVSGIWWKRVDACLKAIAFTPLLLLGGCDVSQLLLGRTASPAPPEALPPPRSDASQSDVSAGLSPLPTPQQVLTAVSFGRNDPFGPLFAAASSSAGGAPQATGQAGASPQASGAAAAGSPAGPGAAASGGKPGPSAAAIASAFDDFRFTGVIRSGGQAQALVSFAGSSGSLRRGDQGGRTTDLLPPGWSLASTEFGGRTPDEAPKIVLLRGRSVGGGQAPRMTRVSCSLNADPSEPACRPG